MAQPPRIAVLGPRATRQGLGPWFARSFERAGARVVAVAGRNAASVEEARAGFAAEFAHPVSGYVGLAALLEAEALDALVIASPNETHGPALELALAHRTPVLCEKPMIWPAEPARAEALVAGFRDTGLLLQINAQWPFTLPAYWKLFPSAGNEPITKFWMRLSPTARGAQMLPDALPHPLSLLQALVPGDDATLTRIAIEISREETEVSVSFGYCAASRDVDCRIELVHCPQQPRPAGYGINDRMAHRRIEMPAYTMRFASETGEVPVPDPLDLLVADFLDALQTGRTPKNCFSPVQRIRMLEQVVRSAQ